MITLRPYQQDAIEALRSSFRAGHRSPLLVMPTGAGKTVTFSYLASSIASHGKRTVIMVHREELQQQVCETLRRFDVAHGRIAAGQPYDRRMLTQVASVFALARRVDSVDVPDYVICDEAHHCIAGSSWGKVVEHWRAKNPRLRLVGVTATPERLSGEGLGEVFDDLIIGPTTRELIDLGALSSYRLFAPAQQMDFSGVSRRAGDYARGEVESVMDKPAVTGDACAHYRRHCDGAPAVAFCVSVAHAEHVAEQFRSIGYRAASIDGKMDRTLRQSLIAEFGRGAINVLTSCDLISEGFDVPGIVSAILLRPTQSLSLYLQQVGRALRVAPGKTHALILDHVGNSARHGMPDDVREWSLIGREGGRKSKAGEASARQCEKCYAMSPAAARACRECGAEFPAKPREVEVREGELSEVDVLEARRQAKRDQGAAQSIEALIELGRMRGMKNPAGWARHVWESRMKKRGAA